MSDIYNGAHRQLQDRFGTRGQADRIDERMVSDTISEADKAFIERMDMFFLASVDDRGRVNSSYKGGEPGFVRVIDDRTIAFPYYDGNGMYLSMGNISANGQVGLLFIDFEHQRRIRFNGEATIDDGDPLMAAFPDAEFIVRVRAREVFANCPRYIHEMKLVRRSKFTPRLGNPALTHTVTKD